MKLVSVVIPTFNRSAFIDRAIDSVLAQTYPDIEVIVVDDASSDDTVARVRARSKSNPRVRLIVQGQQAGAQAARNAGIRAANGAWVAFLDSDDEFLPESVELRVEALHQSGCEVVHSECYWLKPGEDERRLFQVPPLTGWIFRILLQTPGPMFQGIIASKGALERISYLDESILSWQEWDTAIRLAQRYAFVFVSQPTFVYDCRHGGTISKNPLRTARGYEQVVVKHRRQMLKHLGAAGLSRQYQRAANFYREASSPWNAWRCSIVAGIWRTCGVKRLVSGYGGRVRSKLRRWGYLR
jgi:glycosyltransferase involved in cell wall biosynthesis